VLVIAFTGDEMAEAVIKDIYDLQTNVPSLVAAGAALLSGQAPTSADLEAIQPFQTLGWGFNALRATIAARPKIVEDIEDDRPGGEPEHYAVISVKKDFDVANGVYGYVQGDFSHTSDIILNGSDDPYAIQDGYNVVNLRLLMNVEEQDMDVVVWARNSLDEEYINRTNFNAPTSTHHYKRAN
jgi:hypothetical protein